MIKGGLGSSKPLIFARGNHDTRGSFAREIERYVPIEEGRFYYTRDVGPVHLLIIDTGEDKPDSTQVYARLILVIAGHTHRYSLTPAGSASGNTYPILTVGQGQLAKVHATTTEIRVTVVDRDGSVVNTFTVAKAKVKAK